VVINVGEVIAIVSKSAKTVTIEVYRKRVVRCYKDIETHIEFFMTNQQRVMDISLNYIGFRLVGSIRPLTYF